jgi:hypothetical protein
MNSRKSIFARNLMEFHVIFLNIYIANLMYEHTCTPICYMDSYVSNGVRRFRHLHARNRS